jgi:hypothetical protein
MHGSLPSSSQGADPFTLSRETSSRPQKEDAEFVAFGSWLRENLVYFFMAGSVISQALSFNLISLSFNTMQTPAVLCFLHLLVTCASLALGLHFDVWKPVEPTWQGLRGSIAPTVFYSTQLLLIFSSLHHNSVAVVITWLAVGGSAIDTLVSVLIGESSSLSSLSHEARVSLLVAFGAGVVELIFDSKTAGLGILLLLLWSISKAAECCWDHLLNDATFGGRLTDFRLVGQIRDLAEEQLSLSSSSRSTICLAQNLLPIFPILILGLIFGEGKELVDHEPTVPGLKIMLLACAAYAVNVCCLLILNDRHLTDGSTSSAPGPVSTQASEGSKGQKRQKPPPSVLRTILKASSFLLAILLHFLEMPTLSSFAASLLAVIAVLSSFYSTWKREREGLNQIPR